MILAFLTSKVGAILLAIALALATFGFISKSVQLVASEHKVAGLEVTVKQLQTDNAILKKNVETITKVNETNVETNKKLLQERADAQAAIANLAKQKASNKKQLDAANAKIDELLKDPKNNGAVSPVLRETIRGIQEKTK